MRYRPLANSEKALNRLHDQAPWPGHAQCFECDLIEAGVPSAALPAVVDLFHAHGLRFAAGALRCVILSLGRSAAATALKRAVLGGDGRSLSRDARECGTSKQALSASVKRIKTKLLQSSD
jgi:hypothetical protein